MPSSHRKKAAGESLDQPRYGDRVPLLPRTGVAPRTVVRHAAHPRYFQGPPLGREPPCARRLRRPQAWPFRTRCSPMRATAACDIRAAQRQRAARTQEVRQG